MLLSERTASGSSQKLGTVCEACNNGWMSDLESAFASLLPRLQADMSPRQFSKAERRTIALWIVKTGIIVHYSSNYRIILPASVPRTLSQGMTVPAGIKVFGGSVPRKKPSDGANRISASPLFSTPMSPRSRAVKTHLCLCSRS